jgi:CBS domain-containing protein
MRVADIREYQENRRPLLSVDVSTPLPDAIRKMADHDYGAIVATRNDAYAGLFTERMLLRDLIANNIELERLRIGDVIHDDAPVASLEDDALEKVEALNASQYHHMAVVDGENHFVGMLSESDFASLTVAQAVAHATESAKRGISHAYQPFLILAAVVIYGLFVLTAIAQYVTTTG